MLAFFLAALESDGDKLLFAEVYEQNHALIESTAMRILQNRHDAEDAAQNAYVQIIRHFDRMRALDPGDLPFWIVSVVKNEALMILRKKKRLVPLEDWSRIEDESQDVLGYHDLLRLFTRLPETYRAALEMRFLLEHSGKEIAQKLGITESAVNTRISRGQTLLKELLEKEGFRE